MSFPYNTDDWDTLHTLPINMEDLLHPHPQLPAEQQPQHVHDSPPPPTIDNTPILLHHPGETPQIQPRHLPRAPSTPSSIHPIDAIILSRPSSSASTRQLISQFAPSPGRQFIPSPVPTPVPQLPSAASSASRPLTGAIRRTRTRTAHPYLRQTHTQTPPPPEQGQGQGQAPPMVTRSRARKQSVKFADGDDDDAPPTPRMTRGRRGGMMLDRRTTHAESDSAHVRSSAMSQPMDTPGVSLSTPPITSSDNPTQPPPQSPTTPQPTSTHATTTSSSSSASRTRPKIPPYRLTTLPIHTDMSYSPQTHTLSCSLELPGVHPSHLRLSLGTCYFNHVKYVGVVAESVPVFGRESVLAGGAAAAPGDRQEAEAEAEEKARRGLTAEMVGGIRSGLRWSDGGERFGGGGEGGADHVKIGRIVNPNLRERKFGIFRRFIQVPPYTTSKDIAATLKLGILTLQINCGAPFEQDDEEELPVALE